jgi:hypothetical protein
VPAVFNFNSNPGQEITNVDEYISTTAADKADIPTLFITNVVTADDPWRQPWPPNEPGLWVVVRRLTRDFTLWRQIRPTTPATGE